MVAVVRKKETKTALVRVESGTELGKAFTAPANDALLSQYIRYYRFNQRSGTAKAKTRGEVAGSGRKPWRQKHTGRARVGDIRSPVWRHGGVSHGPVVKDWSLKLTKQMKSKVFLLAVSNKVQTKSLYSLATINLIEARTKEALNLIKDWGLEGNLLLVTNSTNKNLVKATGNLKTVAVRSINNVCAYDMLAAKNVVVEGQALAKLAEKYA